MVKFNGILWFSLLIFFNNFQYGQMLQCYLCADCGTSFTVNYPYMSIVTNQNYGASCIKTVSTVSSGTLVSRGTTFSCTQTSTSDIKVYCCQTDLCNRSNLLKQIVSLLLFPIFYSFYLLFN